MEQYTQTPSRKSQLQTVTNCRSLLSRPEKDAALGRTSSLPRHLAVSPLKLSAPVVTPPRRQAVVQRAPSRLYRAQSGAVPQNNNTAKYCGPNTCIGPEFIVRSTHPSKFIQLPVRCTVPQKRKVIVILLNGQKLELICDSNVTTAGQVFEAVVRSEKLRENFTLGLAALLGGDFVFLEKNTHLRKVAPPAWGRDSLPSCSLTLYLRIKFFLPSLRGFRSWSMKHMLYLQLRRNLLEQQLVCDLKTHISMAGLALQAEFGDYTQQEHGTGDYFLVEHYLPEALFEDEDEEEGACIRAQLQEAHKRRHGLDPGRAEELFIGLSQSMPHYGSHFFHAVAIAKNLESKDVLLAINPNGIFLNDREDKSLLEKFLWKNIQRLWYNKQHFLLLPNCGDEIGKRKFLMEHKKSSFVFHLASCHHQFFLKLRSEMSSLQPLSAEFGIPVKESPKCMSSPEQPKIKSSSKKPDVVRLHTFSSKINGTKYQVGKPVDNSVKKLNKSDLCSTPQMNLSIRYGFRNNKENEVPCRPSSVWRPGVKMGTRVLVQRDLFWQPPSLPEDTVSLPALSDCSPCATPPSEAYVVNSSIRSTDEQFLVDLQESLSQSLLQKFDDMSFAEERALTTVRISKDDNGSFGIQITSGSNGEIFIQSVVEGGPADKLGVVHKGDQVMAVDGRSLISMKYEEALHILLTASSVVELLLSQPLSKSKERNSDEPNSIAPPTTIQFNDTLSQSVNEDVKRTVISCEADVHMSEWKYNVGVHSSDIKNNPCCDDKLSVQEDTVTYKPVHFQPFISEPAMTIKLKSPSMDNENSDAYPIWCVAQPKSTSEERWSQV
ncbi:tyrosine-protein phosphatase non-receptor type 13-like [Schistocerca nitens]|uniref:tyrosine-protein phosphatase non-receptor type 13-like n=1 Tax=Schistocerca nitens TaxID=7011 RepID=UPI0021175FAE|nr:tyrosine-protein phosphatase non-receptor type 13-like [Schistocerca nitens]